MKPEELTEGSNAPIGGHRAAWSVFAWALLLFLALSNAVPGDVRYVSGDFALPSGVADRYAELVGATDGRGMLWYGLFFLFECLGIEGGATVPAFLFLFLSGSFVSFRWFLRKLFPGTDSPLSALLSLAYAVNTLTLAFFLSGWIFSPSHLLYPFLPALSASLIAFLRAPTVRRGAVFLALFFPVTTAFVHPEALAIAFLFLALLPVSAFLFGWARVSVRSFVALSVLGIMMLALSAYALPSAVTAVRHGESGVVSESLMGAGWLAHDAGTAVVDTLRLLSEGGMSSLPIGAVGRILTVIPVFVLFFALLSPKPDRDRRRLFFVPLSLLAISVVLLAKARMPFTPLAGMLFSLPGAGVFRGSWRLATIVPFLLLFAVVASGIVARYRKASRWLLLVAVLFPLPYFLPWFHWSDTDSAPDVVRTGIVRIPDDYLGTAAYLRRTDPEATVARFPFTGLAEYPGWEYMPSWGLLGADIFPDSFPGIVLSANRPYGDGFLYARDFALSTEDPRWILPFLHSSGIRYLLLMRDAPEDAVEAVEEKFTFLRQVGAIEPVRESETHTLYRVNGTVLPRILVSATDIAVAGRPTADLGLLPATEAFVSREPEPESDGHGYAVPVGKGDAGKSLVFTEAFSPHYGAVLVAPDGRETGLWHVAAFGFGNGWRLPEKIVDGSTVRIVYYPERFVGSGRGVSLAAFLCVIMILVTHTIYERRTR